jgi:Flp pilus assembly protein TadG
MNGVNSNVASPRVTAEIQSRAERVRARRGGSAGAAIVELALALPFLLIFMTGLFTFGVALNNYLMLTDAVSVSGRQLAISRGNTTNPCTTVTAAFFGVSPLLSTSSLQFEITINGTVVSGSGWTASPSCSSSSTTTGAAGNLVQGANAQVYARYPCKLEIYGANFAPSCYLYAQTTEVVQ